MADAKNKNAGNKDIGFGKKSYNTTVRFLNKDGTVNIKRNGLKFFDNLDVYHWLITARSRTFTAVVLIGYFVTNTIFATMYFILGVENFGGIETADKFDQYLDLFFFSAQTLTTVGYGHVYPHSSSVSSVAAIESLMGLMGFALATGVIYGRFSRPKVSLLYSDNVLISPYEGIKGLMFRIANTKQNELIETEASVVLSYIDLVTNKREFENLPLEINKINFLPTSWTIVHPIDDKSPINNFTLEDLRKRDAELIILIKAINDTYSQTVYSRMSYKADEFIEKAKFVPIVPEAKGGKITIKLTDIHRYNKLE